MTTNFNIPLLDVLSRIISEKLELGINPDTDKAHLLDASSIIFYKDYLVGSDWCGSYEATIKYADIEYIEGIKINPEVDEDGMWSVDFKTELRYHRCNLTPLKFNRLRVRR